ncbi:MAG: transposase [Fulvivirga sp.]
MEVIKTDAQFFTATIYQWKNLLEPDKYKLIITDSLSFLVKEKRVWVYAFVIMNNHIHLIWQMRGEHKREAVQRDFLKFTAQAIKFDLTKYHPGVLSAFRVKMKDRAYNFWQRKPLSVDLFSKRVFFQKLDYIHNNPVRAGLCEFPEHYTYSSAGFYIKGDLKFPFLAHYAG